MKVEQNWLKTLEEGAGQKITEDDAKAIRQKAAEFLMNHSKENLCPALYHYSTRCGIDAELIDEKNPKVQWHVTYKDLVQAQKELESSYLEQNTDKKQIQERNKRYVYSIASRYKFTLELFNLMGIKDS